MDKPGERKGERQMAYENDLKEQFYRAAESGMVRHMPPMYKDVVVERREGRGANGTEKVWMVANVPGRKLALAFRADMWYEGHADEIRRDMDAAVGTFAKACMAEMWDGGELLQKTERDIERMTWDYGAVKPRLGMRLYGLEGNREYLEGYPHKEWGDFAVAYHVRMEDGDCMVTNEMARRLGVTLEEIHADAMAAERARCRLHEVAEIMGLVGGRRAGQPCLDEPAGKGCVRGTPGNGRVRADKQGGEVRGGGHTSGGSHGKDGGNRGRRPRAVPGVGRRVDGGAGADF